MVDNTKIFCELSIQYIDRKIKLIFLKDNIKNYRIKEEKKKRDRDFALKNKNPCSACEFQAKQGISIWGIKLLFFSV